jgi:DNA repair protein RAD50
MPPTARAGHTFVNDPALTDCTEVKANIKLRFIHKRNKVAVVVRSFQLTKKKATVQFKALDGVIRMTDNGILSPSIH